MYTDEAKVASTVSLSAISVTVIPPDTLEKAEHGFWTLQCLFFHSFIIRIFKNNSSIAEEASYESKTQRALVNFMALLHTNVSAASLHE